MMIINSVCVKLIFFQVRTQKSSDSCTLIVSDTDSDSSSRKVTVDISRICEKNELSNHSMVSMELNSESMLRVEMGVGECD